jgi:hypothetical protein
MPLVTRSFKVPAELEQAIEKQASFYGRGFSEEVRLALRAWLLQHADYWLEDPRIQEQRGMPRLDREEVRNLLSDHVHAAFENPTPPLVVESVATGGA